MVGSLHYTLFIQPDKVGSTYDYVAFKETHEVYVSYLVKTTFKLD